MGACVSLCSKKNAPPIREPLSEEERAARRAEAAKAAQQRADKQAIKPSKSKSKSFQSNQNDLVSPSMWN